MRFIKTLCVISAIILPVVASGYDQFGPSVVYIARDCTGVTTGMCGSPNTYNCGSTSSQYAPTGTYASFSICAAVSVVGKTNKMIVCFQNAADCYAVWRCGDYAGDTSYTYGIPKLDVGSNNSVSGAPAGVQNGQQFGCCANCRSIDWRVVGSIYEQRDDRYCSGNNCTVSQSIYRCKKNYYSAKGLSATTDTSYASALGCQPCPDPTVEKAAYTEYAGMTGPGACFLPRNTTLTETEGKYQFVNQPCPYTP